MIVSHTHQFIYFAVPKTATHAIRFALREHLRENDWEQVELFHHSRLPFSEFKELSHGHITASEAQQALGEKVWNSYFKFAFVRNPFDRFISYSFFRNKHSELFRKSKLAKMKLSFQDKSVLKDALFQPQFKFIENENGKSMLDFVGQYENLQEDFNFIAERIGIPSAKLKSLNNTNHQNYRQYYDEELKELVGNYYQRDIEFFDYSF